MNEQHKDFIFYEEALVLKELGFEETCFGHFLKNGFTPKEFSRQENEITLRPTYSQAFRWFREKYELHSWITMELGATLTFCWIVTGENKGTEHKAFFKSYEEAELACLKRLIQIVKK